ncbi:NERD domain-containing protein [Nocardia sp. NPDC060220]|uniref:nuclease-related domain-containing protein n=1 Tax=Nocardia sp. NPDC060220 TaxID=3347076 RepID=UPI00366591DA
MVIVVVADESELEGAEQIVGAALRDQAFRAGGVAVFRCHVPENRGGSVEVDALVCTPQSVTIVEVKGFTARQEGTLATPPNGPWTIDGEPAALYHAVRVPNPFVQVRRQVFAAKSLLQQSGIFGWVNAVIALVAQPGAEITIEETRIADGYRAVLIDRDDAGALHDYFQAESGRTVRLSIDDVTRVFGALNLGHLLPSPDELTAQGFPAALDPATTSRPIAPTAVELGSPSETAVSDTTSDSPAASTGSARASTPAFLAAIDRLAHRPPTAAHPEDPTSVPAERETESPSSSEGFTGAQADESDDAALSATAIGPPDEPIPSTESAEPATDRTSPPDGAEQDSPRDDNPEHEPTAEGTAPDRESATRAEPFDDDTIDLDEPALGEVAESSDGQPESTVSLSKSVAADESVAIDDPPTDGIERHEPTPGDEVAAAGTPAGTGGNRTAEWAPAVGTVAASGAAAAVGAAGSARETESRSTPSPAYTPAVAPSYRSPETPAPQQHPEHWSDWVEHDRTTRQPTLSQKWRSWRHGNGPSLLERWHNRPVRERSAPRRGLRVGPGVALLLFIALFGAGFFAIAAVQASRFEMSDYDRMCGEDKKPFPNAAPYERDGARPIYLSGDLTTMVHPNDPTAWNPDDPSTVQLIACMKQLELRDLVQTCQYGPSPGAPVGRTVNLFRATYEVAVYELRTGREVAKATMLGERYSDNPANTDQDRCRAAADAPDYLGRRLGQPSRAQLTGFLAPLVHAPR